MKIIKRNGSEVIFDITKIIVAITKANETVEENARMTPVQIQRIAESAKVSCEHPLLQPHWPLLQPSKSYQYQRRLLRRFSL